MAAHSDAAEQYAPRDTALRTAIAKADSGTCRGCGEPIRKGDVLLLPPALRLGWIHSGCLEDVVEDHHRRTGRALNVGEAA